MSLFNSKNVTAKLVGHNLVASFGTANPPLVWQFDLERNHSFTIALQGEGGDWELGITSPKGEFYPIAHFPSREDAEEALNKIQKILLKKKRSWFWSLMRWLLILLFIGLIWVVFGFFKTLSPMLSLGDVNLGAVQNLAPAQMMPAQQPVIPRTVAPADIKPGVPLSADDILQAPR